MALTLDPIPQSDDLIDSNRKMNDRWFRWLSAFVGRVTIGVQKVASLHRAGLSSSLVATTAYTVTQTGIVFLVSWRAGVTTAAGVSSSIAVTISWTNDAGVACSKAFAAQAGNTTGTADGDDVPIRPKSGTPIQYSTTYASNPAAAMQYDLDIVVQDLT